MKQLFIGLSIFLSCVAVKAQTIRLQNADSFYHPVAIGHGLTFHIDTAFNCVELITFPSKDSGKIVIIGDTMLAIRSLVNTYVEQGNKFEGWKNKYWALVDLMKTSFRALDGDKKAIKHKPVAEKRFQQLQEQYP